MNKDIEIFQKARKMELARLRRIAEGATDDGPDASPYCRLFMHDNCEQCPIKLRAGYSDCRLSPYAEWAKHQSEAHFKLEPPYRIECDHCRELLGRVYSFTKHAPLFMEEQIELI
jgi:hypothetical protein